LSENEEYDLRKSAEKIGELYPILVAKTGETIDGFHRENAKANWRREVRENIDSPEKVLEARLIANKFRRQVTAEEVRGWINDLAEIAMMEYGKEPGEISDWIAEETGYQRKTVRQYLNEKYLSSQHSQAGKIGANIINIIRYGEEVDVLAPILAEEIVRETAPTIDLDTSNGLHKASLALERKAKSKVKAKKTPEQIEAEKAEKKRRQQENAAKKREQQIQREQQLKEKARQEVTEETRQEIQKELLKDDDFLQKTSMEYHEKITREALKQTPEEKKQAWQRKQAEKYGDLIIDTYFKIRGWGVPMVLAMGREEWDKNRQYIEGIHNWTGWLLKLDPQKNNELPPPTTKTIDTKQIVEAEYQVLEVKK